jgi:hypothetical protein
MSQQSLAETTKGKAPYYVRLDLSVLTNQPGLLTSEGGARLQKLLSELMGIEFKESEIDGGINIIFSAGTKVGMTDHLTLSVKVKSQTPFPKSSTSDPTISKDS